MRIVYPIVMSKGSEHIVVYIPDFDINTQGENYAEAMEMAREAICLMGIDLEEDGECVPAPSELSEVLKERVEDVVSFVDVDFEEYRKKQEKRTVRRNVSLPAWLNAKAEEAGLNVSAVLQAALKKELNI